MPWRICFKLPLDRWFCIPLYVEIPRFWVDPNPPDPLDQFDFRHIQTLAVIDQLAERLGNAGDEIRAMVGKRMEAAQDSLGSSLRIERTAERSAGKA